MIDNDPFGDGRPYPTTMHAPFLRRWGWGVGGVAGRCYGRLSVKGVEIAQRGVWNIEVGIVGVVPASNPLGASGIGGRLGCYGVTDCKPGRASGTVGVERYVTAALIPYGSVWKSHRARDGRKTCRVFLVPVGGVRRRDSNAGNSPAQI